VLVGPSGSGKSTVLRLMAGLERVSDGVSHRDRDVTGPCRPSSATSRWSFQNYALYPHMTVRQNLGFGLSIRKQPPAVIATRVDADRGVARTRRAPRPETGAALGRQRQTRRPCRAIVREPLAFLFDEPLSNLDASSASRRESSSLGSIASSARTMVYVHARPVRSAGLWATESRCSRRESCSRSRRQ